MTSNEDTRDILRDWMDRQAKAEAKAKGKAAKGKGKATAAIGASDVVDMKADEPDVAHNVARMSREHDEV